MAFEGLSAKLADVFKNLKGKGKLTEKDVAEAMRQVRLALLEADVNFKLVKEFVNTVTEKAVGEELYLSISPGQHVIKIVHEELIALMGTDNAKLTYSNKPPTIYMMVGLQGAGKTTATGKLAALLKKQGRRPLLAACDIYRPAAVKQLMVVGQTAGVPVFEMGTDTAPLVIAQKALEEAKKQGNDVVILDTAGRLHVDEELMNELSEIKAMAEPTEILLVVDSMTGQEAVNVAQSFNEKIGISGIILTKLDGDTRGGAAISVRKVTGSPIKFISTGEKISADTLEPFYPDRMASRILGMGDVLSLIEKAQENFDESQAAELERKMRKNEFNLEDFLSQMQQMKKMGPLKDILGMLPGMPANIGDVEINEKALAHVEAIIHSMTPYERRNPQILNGPRKKRIANGSGRSIAEVNKLLKQFEDMKKMMKQFTNPGKKGKFSLPFLK